MLGPCLLPEVQRCTKLSLRFVASCMILACPLIFGSQSFNPAPVSIEEPVVNRGNQGRELSWNDRGEFRYQIEENHSSESRSYLGQCAPSRLIAEDDMISDETFWCVTRRPHPATNCRPIGYNSLLIEVLPATPAAHTLPPTRSGASPLMGNTRSVARSIVRLSEMIWNQLGLWAQCFSFEAVDHEFESICQAETCPLPGQE
jgi:hypothetical protein